MKKILLAVVVNLLAAQAFAGPIIMSCYRGPFKDVIWDRPNPVFIDTLMEHGYSLGSATLIAERICLDPELVDDPEKMKSTLLGILKKVRKGN